MFHHPHHRLATLLIAFVAVAAVTLTVEPALAAASDGSTFTSIVNRYRANAGAGPVLLHAAVDQIAVERAGQLAQAQQLGHDLSYVANRLQQLGVCWQAIGEIVAWNTSGDYEAFVSQWYNSDGHRAIMLDPTYTHVGGSSRTGADGRRYAVMIFIRLCGGSTAGGFTDVASSPFVADIEWLVDAGITEGCDVSRFCPTAVVAREQMASFIARAEDLAAADRDYFTDDTGSTHEGDINRIGEANITNGCASGRYCPSAGVTRAQMASFLVRALSLPAASRDYFGDDTGSPHEDAINRLAAAGITQGCGGGSYCPAAWVTREQMAAFLRRAFS